MDTSGSAGRISFHPSLPGWLGHHWRRSKDGWRSWSRPAFSAGPKPARSTAAGWSATRKSAKSVQQAELRASTIRTCPGRRRRKDILPVVLPAILRRVLRGVPCICSLHLHLQIYLLLHLHPARTRARRISTGCGRTSASTLVPSIASLRRPSIRPPGRPRSWGSTARRAPTRRSGSGPRRRTARRSWPGRSIAMRGRARRITANGSVDSWRT